MSIIKKRNVNSLILIGSTCLLCNDRKHLQFNSIEFIKAGPSTGRCKPFEELKQNKYNIKESLIPKIKILSYVVGIIHKYWRWLLCQSQNGWTIMYFSWSGRALNCSFQSKTYGTNHHFQLVWSPLYLRSSPCPSRYSPDHLSSWRRRIGQQVLWLDPWWFRSCRFLLVLQGLRWDEDGRLQSAYGNIYPSKE